MVIAARIFFSCLVASFASMAPAQTPTTPPLEGVWKAYRHFGPALRGTLTVSRERQALRAEIGPFAAAVSETGGKLSFSIPGKEGSFSGRIAGDGAIHGHWVQPPTVNEGAYFASPVVLRPVGHHRWQGEVIPLEDEFTLYLVFSGADPGGNLRAFIRNPDRNIGLVWDVQRVELAPGNGGATESKHVKLVGKRMGRGADMIFGEGEYFPAENRLTIHFPQRGGSYDFHPLDEPGIAGFQARAASGIPWQYRMPPATGDGWKTALLNDVGMDSAPIGELIKVLDKAPTNLHDPDIHGVLIARHGKLVVEEYFHGFHRLKPHETRSAAKVFASTLAGAAIMRDKEKHLSVFTRVYDVMGPLPPDADPRKKDMTLEHLMTMSSGYDCDDWAGDRPGSEDKLLDDLPEADYYRYTLDLPLEMKPGTEAVYCSINPNLTGGMIARAVNRPLPELFEEWIAAPLGMTRYHLNLQPTGEPYFGGGIKVLPRDFMKLGQVMLNGGTWNGRRIFSKEFAAKAGQPLTQLRGIKDKGMRYGYFWWTVDFPYRDRKVSAYFASGNGGQEVVVIPELDIVIASYGGSYNDVGGWIMIREYIARYILPAVK